MVNLYSPLYTSPSWLLSNQKIAFRRYRNNWKVIKEFKAPRTTKLPTYILYNSRKQTCLKIKSYRKRLRYYLNTNLFPNVDLFLYPGDANRKEQYYDSANKRIYIGNRYRQQYKLRRSHFLSVLIFLVSISYVLKYSYLY